MIPDHHKNTVFLADTLAVRFPGLWQQIHDACERHGVACRTIQGTRDIWCRDYMPVQLAPGRFVQFRYEPDYLRGYEETITPVETRRAALAGENCESSDIVLDGGNIVSAAGTAILTDKIYAENPTLKRSALRRQLHNLLEVDHLVIIPQEPGDWTGHADGALRFVDEHTVVVNDCARVDPSYGRKLRKCLSQARLDVIDLPYVPQADQRPDRFPPAFGTYVNFLRVSNLLLVPAYRIKEDDAATTVLGRCYPGCHVVPIYCRGVAAEGGVLNCVSWSVFAAPLTMVQTGTV